VCCRPASVFVLVTARHAKKNSCVGVIIVVGLSFHSMICHFIAAVWSFVSYTYKHET
jgi:hypothetical protein